MGAVAVQQLKIFRHQPQIEAWQSWVGSIHRSIQSCWVAPLVAHRKIVEQNLVISDKHALFAQLKVGVQGVHFKSRLVELQAAVVNQIFQKPFGQKTSR